eukprot:TRINITY_DN759_c0_g1_i3.p1 TRINITY_DN759_c0_g1~~TRINITY_DN759_c0_g1_i3.p1  ORF type:complete len:395 (+),score=84.83 TRINITY_DN759_c0_g1_i3:159-1187(+)
MAAHRPAARAIGSDGPPPPAPAVGDVSRSVRLPKGRVFVVPRGAEGGYGDRSTTVAEAVAAAASGAPDGGECMTVARAGGGGGGGGGGATAVRLVGPAATGAPTARWPAAANRQTAVSGSLGHGTRVTKVPSITSAAAAAIHAMARIASTRSVSMHGGVCGGGGGEGGAGTDGTGGAGGAGASPTPVTDGPSGGGTTDGGGSGTPEESSDTDDSECFPAAATVQLEGGGVTTMDRLSVGDRVRTASGSYSDVFPLYARRGDGGPHVHPPVDGGRGLDGHPRALCARQWGRPHRRGGGRCWGRALPPPRGGVWGGVGGDRYGRGDRHAGGLVQPANPRRHDCR